MSSLQDEHTPTFVGTRFDILRRLGAGGMGIVYEAYDRERDVHLALKTLKRLNPASLLRFKNEFRSLADIKHPNLVTLYELISHNDQWFFTMEIVEGVDLLSYVRGLQPAPAAPADPWGGETATATGIGTAAVAAAAANAGNTLETMVSPVIDIPPEPVSPPADSGRLAATMPQLVAAISALHASGHLHRDIKPSNILVTKEGRVAVLDFGVIRSLSGRHQTHAGEEVVGTPAYMAPEQAQPGAEPTPASDWYSVGVILYTALAGCRPFRGTANEIIEAKQELDPPPPSTLQDGIDPRLEDLTMGLLRRDPEKRLTGAHLVRALSSPSEAFNVVAHDTDVAEPVDAAIVGRERHLDALREAFAETQRGTGITVHVHGRSGMGKSTLAARFIDELDKDGVALVLAGRCYERESMPYQAIDSLVDDLCGHLLELPRHDADALMPLDVASLARAFPVLRRVEAIARARRRATKIASDPIEIRKQVFAALRELLARLAQTQPLVLFIDDLQWGDLDSAGFLASLMEPPTPPLLFIISYRSEEAESSPILRRLLGTRGGGQDIRELQVHRLSLSQGRQLAELLLAQAGVSLDAAERIARESGGNPFFIQEFVRFVAHNEAAGMQLESLDLAALIESRVATLTTEAQTLLELIAVAATPISHDVARRSAALADKHPLALAELRAAHLVRTSGVNSHDLVECFHDRIRETVAGAVTGDRRPAVHLRLARGIEASDKPDSESLAVHFAAAGERRAAFEHSVIAADAAADALAFARAAAFYSHSLDLRPDDDDAVIAGLGRKLGDALVNAGRGGEAADAYLLAAASSGAEDNLQLSVRAGTELLRCGHVDAGLDVLAPALRGAGLKISSKPWRTVLSLSLWRMVIRLRGLRFRERSIAEIRPQTLAKIDAIWAAASAFGMADNLRGADIQTRHLLRTLGAGDAARVGRALAFEAAYASFAGPAARGRTDKILSRVGSIAERTQEPRLRGLHQAATALVLYQYGEWQPCVEFSLRGQEILREQCTGATWELTSAQLYQVWALLWQGHLAEMSERTAVFLKDARERGDVYSMVNLSTGLPSLSGLIADDPSGTRGRAEHARRQWSRGGYHLQHYWSQLALAQAELYSGEGRAAYERACGEWQSLKRMFFLRISMVRCEMLQFRARCALSAAAATAHDRERLLGAAAGDTKRLAKERIAWCAPAAKLLRAGIERTRDPAADVRELLASAAEGLHAADTHGHAMIAEYYHGKLIGGDEGAALIAGAEQWMSGEGVVNMARFAQFYAPGFD